MLPKKDNQCNPKIVRKTFLIVHLHELRDILEIFAELHPLLTGTSFDPPTAWSNCDEKLQLNRSFE
jgi:hypothetical protein